MVVTVDTLRIRTEVRRAAAATLVAGVLTCAPSRASTVDASLADYYAAREPDPLDSSLNPATIPAGRSKAVALRCAQCHGSAMQGSESGAARLAGQKPRYTAWALHQMRGGSRSHGADKDSIAGLSNDDIDALAEYFASLR